MKLYLEWVQRQGGHDKDLEAAMSHAPVTMLSKLNRAVREFVRDESGVTSIEYALIGSLIAVAIVLSVANLGAAVQGLYELVAEKVAEAMQ